MRIIANGKTWFFFFNYKWMTKSTINWIPTINYMHKHSAVLISSLTLFIFSLEFFFSNMTDIDLWIPCHKNFDLIFIKCPNQNSHNNKEYLKPNEYSYKPEHTSKKS